MNYEQVYSELHRKEKRFPGFSIGQYINDIAALVEQHRPTRLIDYGSGKGFQYLVRRYHEKWGGMLPYCYDIGVRQLRDKPEGTFGGVLCTDMLEHIERKDLPGIFADLINYAEPNGFMMLGIACRPSNKDFGGVNLHVTVEHPDWWVERIQEHVSKLGRSDLHVRAGFDIGDTYPDARRRWDSGE